MVKHCERILNQIFTAIAEIWAQTGQEPNKIILGIDVYNALYEYIAFNMDETEEPKHLHTVANIPITVDTVNVNRISVCIEHNIKIGEEDNEWLKNF